MKSILVSLCCGFAGAASAQPPGQVPGQTAPRAAPAAPSPTLEVRLGQADLAFVATVRADQLRFNGEPRAQLELRAEPGGTVQDELIRSNLPRPVQPGVTYRDVDLAYVGAVRLTPPATPRESATERSTSSG